jgi:hypothetical protein
LLGLGEFSTDSYEDSNYRVLLWIYFMIATLLTQLIFINTLIAVLGDTYGRIMERKEITGLI